MPSYPLAWPTTVTPSGLILTRRVAQASTVSPSSLAEQVHDLGGNRWEATLRLPRMTKARFAPLDGMLAGLNGRVGWFTMGLFDRASVMGVGGTGITVRVQPSLLDMQIELKGFATDTDDVLLAGDVFSIGTVPRLYQCIADVSSDASGFVTVETWPGMREAYAVDAAVDLTDPQGSWRLAGTAGIAREAPHFYSGSLDLVERLP